jgi:hypothetical protein
MHGAHGEPECESKHEPEREPNSKSYDEPEREPDSKPIKDTDSLAFRFAHSTADVPLM